MSYKIHEIKRGVKRRLKKVVQKERDGNYRRRAQAILMLSEGASVAGVARSVHASETSIRKWRKCFESLGECGLVPQRSGRASQLDKEKIRDCLKKSA